MGNDWVNMILQMFALPPDLPILCPWQGLESEKCRLKEKHILELFLVLPNILILLNFVGDIHVVLPYTL